MTVTRASGEHVTRGWWLRCHQGASDTNVTRGPSRRFPRSIDRFAFRRFQNKAPVEFVLHPGMPEKAVVVCTVTACGIADVCYGNEPMRGKLLNKAHYVPA